MGHLQELDKLSRATSDAEIRLKSIYAALDKLQHEISVLTPLELQLQENITFLKRAETIPILNEYRKVKQELIKTKTRLNLIATDRDRTMQACIDVEQIIERFKKDYYKLLVSGENNLLKGKFNKHGQNTDGE